MFAISQTTFSSALVNENILDYVFTSSRRQAIISPNDG